MFIFVTLLLPRGLMGLLPRRRVARTRQWPRRAGSRAGSRRGAGGDRMSDAVVQSGDTLLYLDGVTVSFDGFRALNALSLVLEAGEMRAVIGPNGAGKTTMMDVITGKTRPDAGQSGVRQGHRPDPPGRAGDRGTWHRAQVPEADGVRAAYGLGQSAAVAGRGSPAALHPVGARDARRTRADRGDPGHHAADRAAPPAAAAICRTGRSSGWRSACCWRRNRNCCWWTNRWPA